MLLRSKRSRKRQTCSDSEAELQRITLPITPPRSRLTWKLSWTDKKTLASGTSEGIMSGRRELTRQDVKRILVQ